MLLIKKKKFLICFVGIDGSGKTTLAKDFIELLNDKGIKTRRGSLFNGSNLRKQLNRLGVNWAEIKNQHK